MPIITVSREMGSGGFLVSERVAEKLGYKFLDGEAIREMAEGYGLSVDAIRKVDEKPPPFDAHLDQLVELDLQQIELLILESALQGNVLIYGRGAHFILGELKGIFRVRFIAPLEERVERWAEREWLDPDLAREMVRKSDQQRAGFIKYYFDRNWDNPLEYDLVINMSRITLDTAVDLVCKGVRDKNLLRCQEENRQAIADLIIQKRLRIAILSTPDLDGYHVEISCEDGVVTLGGHVHSREEQRLVMEMAKAISGIKEIWDGIRIKPYRTTSPYPVKPFDR
ncbi:MAG: BON domain-containing protein [Desulfuromonadaceae bacterium]|nr:BON domain-containing protein [Desulfuromonadaceae bacterium]